MLKFNIKSAVVILLLVFNSCNNKDDCKTIQLNAQSLETLYGCSNTRYGLQIDLTENYTIIRSQEDFENKVSGSCIPKIDFALYDLVIGRKGLSSDNTSINYILTADCKNVLKLRVIFNQSDALNAPTVTYHALVHKLGDEETIKVEFAYNN